MDSFWRALADGGWPQAEQFLTPELRASRPGDESSPWQGEERPRRAHVAWIAALQGGEPQASLRFEVEFEIAPQGLEKLATFLYKIGEIKNPLKSWKDVSMPQLYQLNGN